jgi:hypothetical protein
MKSGLPMDQLAQIWRLAGMQCSPRRPVGLLVWRKEGYAARFHVWSRGGVVTQHVTSRGLAPQTRGGKGSWTSGSLPSRWTSSSRPAQASQSPPPSPRRCVSPPPPLRTHTHLPLHSRPTTALDGGHQGTRLECSEQHPTPELRCLWSDSSTAALAQGAPPAPAPTSALAGLSGFGAPSGPPPPIPMATGPLVCRLAAFFSS